jgi:2-dehydropantoate 2-reductase
LAASGVDVTFMTRPRMYNELSKTGLKLTDYLGNDLCISTNKLKLSQDPGIVSDADIIFVCVKSAATELVDQTLKEYLYICYCLGK